MVHQGGCALVPALCVHICPTLASLGPPMQPVCIQGIARVFAPIMAHTDHVTGHRVCQLAHRGTLGSCRQGIDKCLLPAGSFGLRRELPVLTEF